MQLVHHSSARAGGGARGNPVKRPGLPRSGERKRKPSDSTGRSAWEATASRRGSLASEGESEDLPVAPCPPGHGISTVARDGRRELVDHGRSADAGCPPAVLVTPRGAAEPDRVLARREHHPPRPRAQPPCTTTVADDTGTATPTLAPPTAMRVRKRNGDTEPVDVNKIVRAVDRVSDGLRRGRPAAGRDPDHQRSLRWGDDRRARPALDPDRRRLICEEPEYSRLAARLLAGTSTRRCAVRGSRPSPSRSLLATRRASSATARSLRGGERRQADVALDPANDLGSSTSVCARFSTATS